ncbi:MAG: 50S ribosomal protein L20 [SAR324 cluster bacterium]|nr:50S ribosomal protein L20 [SAR324 cluster bacterium]
MTRIKRGVHANKKRKSILKLAKGYRGSHRKLIRIARGVVEKALQYAYRDRRQKKRDFRALWIMRINAAARQNDITYSQLIDGLKKGDVAIDRKLLADMAVNDPGSFSELATEAKLRLTS